MSEFIDIFVKFSNFVLRDEAFDSLFCPKERDFVHNDWPGGGFLPPFESCPGEEMVLETGNCHVITDFASLGRY